MQSALKTERFFSVCFFILSFMSLTAFSEGTAVEFHGIVTGVSLTSGAVSSISLRIMGFAVPVTVTADTEVQSEGDLLKLTDLDVGDFVMVSGFFVNSGITASEIHILDSSDGEFRLRGLISGVRSASNGTIVTVLGDDVLINSGTKLDRRGSGGPITTADLAANQTIDVRGFAEDGQFIAKQAKVGDREDDAIRVHFSGTAGNVTPSSFTVDTGGGNSAVVLTGPNTLITGKLAAGQFVEVTGTLNANLQVVASRVNAKANEKDDDIPRPVTIFESHVPILPVGAASTVHGDAKIHLDTNSDLVHQNIDVNLKGGTPNTSYKITVDVAGAGTVSIGSTQTNAAGNASLHLTNPSAVLPASKTVRDITKLQVLASDGTVVAQATF